MKMSSTLFGIMIAGVVVSGGLVASGGVTLANDMAKIAPHNTKILFENERIRVLETRIKPGETLRMHTHPPRVNYFKNPLKEKITYEGKLPQEFSFKAGEVAFYEAEALEVENIGTTEGVNIVVELKK